MVLDRGEWYRELRWGDDWPEPERDFTSADMDDREDEPDEEEDE